MCMKDGMGSLSFLQLMSRRAASQKKNGYLRLPQRRQTGIGVIGFIVGIVVGLAVALAVAVYITKVPTPFTGKGDKKTEQEQAEEEERLKSWNPNAPLASKAGNASAGAEQTAQAGGQQPGSRLAPGGESSAATPGGGWATPTNREQELEQAKVEAEAKLQADLRAKELARAKAKAEEEQRAQEQARANASNDPIGALLQARSQQQNSGANTASTQPTSTSANTGGSKDPFIYYVQVGAFREQTGADAQRARLTMMGMSARINQREQAGRAVYQVRLGPFNTKAEADNARSRVENNGMETALVRVQR